MADFLFNQAECKKSLKTFFEQEKASINSFGSLVNQTFEAYAFASTIKWYKSRGWKITIRNPLIEGAEKFRLKFSTRGRPSNYSYVVCEKDEERCQIRHQLRVATKSHDITCKFAANICCDIVILKDCDLSHFSTKNAIDNEYLITFGEVKHMNAYAELIASFIGLVYELQPNRLKRIRTKKCPSPQHIPAFLNVSGLLYSTAKGVKETVIKRKYDIDVYSFDEKII